MDSDDDERFQVNLLDNQDIYDDDDDILTLHQPDALRESELRSIQPADDDETFLQAAILQQFNEDKYEEDLKTILALQQPDALRESELRTIPADDDETFLQAAIIQQFNEDKYTEDLQKVLALSLLESGEQNTSSGLSDFIDRAQGGFEEEESYLFQRGASSNSPIFDSGPTAMEKHNTYSLARRPSLERLQTNKESASIGGAGISVRRPSLERLNHGNNDVFGVDEEDQARELRELIQMGIIPSNQVSLKFKQNKSQNNVQPKANFASPRNNSSRVDNSDEIDNEQVLGAEGPETSFGISDLIPVAFTSFNSLENWTTDKTSPRGEIHMYELVKILTDCKEYVAITNDFRSSGLKVISVERLQNKYLLQKFKSEQDQILESRLPGYSLNCRYLYHGTTADKDRLCQEGLDARLSRQGCFGRGIYFSDTPSKCVQYTRSDQGTTCILMCRVILGDSKIYPPGGNDPDLRREPEKTEVTHGWRYYDSVQGSPIDYNEYVVYENRRAMIEYIITYKQDENECLRESAPVKSTSSESVPLTRTIIHPNGQRTVHFNMTEEDHMKLIESVRDNVRKQRAIERGETWIPPSIEQRLAERRKWQHIMKISHDEGNEVIYKKPDKTDTPSTSETDQERDAINEVMSYLITKFLSVTDTDDVEKARRIIEESNMDLDLAIENYFSNLA